MVRNGSLTGGSPQSLVAEANLAARLADNVLGARDDLDLLGVLEATARRASVDSLTLPQGYEELATCSSLGLWRLGHELPVVELAVPRGAELVPLVLRLLLGAERVLRPLGRLVLRLLLGRLRELAFGLGAARSPHEQREQARQARGQEPRGQEDLEGDRNGLGRLGHYGDS